jgi:hypothetical protein
MTTRKTVKITGWPDPLIQERLEDLDFFFDAEYRTWIRFCNENEVQHYNEILKRLHLAHEVLPAKGRGQLKKHPRLATELVLKDGGSATKCALCGMSEVACRQWIEGDDTDSIDYHAPARFFLCGTCVQTRLQPHPRLYAPADEQL